jgi:valyl-tRNA synthetase
VVVPHDRNGKACIEAVMKEDITFYPPKFRNMYRAWMEGIRDWCISRQLWWGHQIPAWYSPDGSYVVARNCRGSVETVSIREEK